MGLYLGSPWHVSSLRVHEGTHASTHSTMRTRMWSSVFISLRLRKGWGGVGSAGDVRLAHAGMCWGLREKAAKPFA